MTHVARLALVAALTLITVPSQACCGLFHRKGRCQDYTATVQYQQTTYTQTVYAQPQIQAAPQCYGGSCPIQAPAKVMPAAQGPVYVPQAVQGGTSEFLVLLNIERRRRGLCEVLHDVALAASARQNNAIMASARYSIHAVNPGCAQASYYGPQSAGQALSGWLASGPHAAILLSPSIRVVGVDAMSNCWTLNAR